MSKHIDYKCTTWVRLHLDDDIDLEDIKKILIEKNDPLCLYSIDEYDDKVSSENLVETHEYISVEENGNQATFELYDEHDTMIYSNAPLP